MNPKHLFGLAFILLFSIVSVSAVTNADINEGLVSGYYFDENTGSTSGDEIGTNDGTISSSTLWTTGKINSGLNFDGSTYYASYARNTNIYIYCLNSWSGDELK